MTGENLRRSGRRGSQRRGSDLGGGKDSQTLAEVGEFGLIAALRIIKYDQVSAILLTILLCVIMVDGLGAWLRRKLK